MKLEGRALAYITESQAVDRSLLHTFQALNSLLARKAQVTSAGAATLELHLFHRTAIHAQAPRFPACCVTAAFLTSFGSLEAAEVGNVVFDHPPVA